MVEPGLFLAFVASVTVLLLFPGPNVALIVANSVAYGPKYGLLTVAGASSGVAVQIGVTALGLTELLGAAGLWFEWLRWGGVAYLVYLGITQWTAPADDLTQVRPEAKSAGAVYARGLLVSLTNPKTLLFYGAFFPQFINPADDVRRQIAMLAATCIALTLVVDSAWALIAARARTLLARKGRLRNRLAGGFLIGAAAALAVVRG